MIRKYHMLNDSVHTRDLVADVYLKDGEKYTNKDFALPPSHDIDFFPNCFCIFTEPNIIILLPFANIDKIFIRERNKDNEERKTDRRDNT